MIASCSKFLGPNADDEAKQAERDRGQRQEGDHPKGMVDAHRHEQRRGRENDEPDADRLGRRGADIGDDRLDRGHRRREELEDRAGEFGKIDADRGVGDALRQKRQHDEARHDERAIADPADVAHSRADRRAEHHEIERGRDHRRRHALPDRAHRALKLVAVDRRDPAEIDRGCAIHAARPTRSTKMSSSVLVVVSRSLKSTPISPRRRSSVGTPVSSAAASKR